MPEHEHIVKVVREWVGKAEEDLRVAAYLLTLGKECPPDVVCFHAQQSVEKYLKALLVLNRIEFPKTHAIRTLAALLPIGSRPAIDEAVQDRLTEYATVTRYPGDYEPIVLSEARKAVASARRVHRDARRLLPKESAQPRGRRRGLRGDQQSDRAH